MKNTILLLGLGLLSISLTNCSRGYGCPYGMGMEIHSDIPEQSNYLEDASLIALEQEDCETAFIAE